ncbi:MAG: ABC transporter substrate-binding protein [Oscillospiraceae bacterium]|nr:ABC transporter substrate-binding protein [Oscillospiraceae bacterium]
MKRKICIVIVICLLAALTVSACGEAAGSNGQVNVYNWGEYIDKDIFRIFERETGIKINYFEFQSNEELYSLLKTGSTTVDVIIPSDYMIGRLIEEGMLEELDFSNIPNFSLIDPKYKNLEFDPQNKFSVAYMTGTVGLIYNSSMISDEITSWSSLFDERYSGQILMFDNPRDAFGIALKYLGYSQNTVNEDEIREAYDLLALQKPLLQAYVMDQIFFKLESGEAAIGPYYAGDYLFMYENNQDLVFVRPVEGSNFFVDSMCIPIGAANKENAEIFINFMSRTDIALKNMAEIMYASANFEAAEQFANELEPWEYEIMFASAEVLANCDVFIHLPGHILALYDQLWIELKR